MTLNKEFWPLLTPERTPSLKLWIIDPICKNPENFWWWLKLFFSYGPFWIYTTLIFALAASGNFSNLIRASAVRSFVEKKGIIFLHRKTKASKADLILSLLLPVSYVKSYWWNVNWFQDLWLRYHRPHPFHFPLEILWI